MVNRGNSLKTECSNNKHIIEHKDTKIQDFFNFRYRCCIKLCNSVSLCCLKYY
jgi:hypothetical protein